MITYYKNHQIEFNKREEDFDLWELLFSYRYWIFENRQELLEFTQKVKPIDPSYNRLLNLELYKFPLLLELLSVQDNVVYRSVSLISIMSSYFDFATYLSSLPYEKNLTDSEEKTREKSKILLQIIEFFKDLPKLDFNNWR